MSEETPSVNGIAGKVAIVTGSGSGIGRATAMRFADEGATVVLADVDEEGGEETARLLRDDDRSATFIRTDVRDERDVRTLVQAAYDEYGRIDFLHNNAGIRGEELRCTEYSAEQWNTMIDTNLFGVWVGMKHAIPKMLEDGGGAIVNTSSVSGIKGSRNSAPYTASKHAVNGLTKTAALEYGEHGIRVNSICPSSVQTPMMEGRAISPLGRAARPAEISSVVVWLCSDEASFVNGVALPVDGGYTAE